MENIMNTVEVKISGKEVLSRVSRMFDNTEESLFLEIFQNARRAGATEIYVKKIEDGLVIGNNGKPIIDFQELLTLGKSGWDKGVLFEDPAGTGFFATTLCDRVSVATYYDGAGKILDIDTKLLSEEGYKFEVKKIDSGSKHFENSSVEYVLYGEFIPLTESDKCYRSTIEEIMSRIPTKMFIEENGLLREVKNMYDANIDNLVFDFSVNNLRFRIYDGYPSLMRHNISTSLNYFGHIISLNLRFHYNKTISITPLVGSDIRLVLPGRHTLVKDDGYNKLIDGYYQTIGNYIMTKLGGKHTLSFSDYEKINSIISDFPEARNPNMKATYLFVDSDYCMYSNIHACLHDFDDVAWINHWDYERFKGYSWLDDYIVINNIKVFHKDKLILDECAPVFEKGLYSSGEIYLEINGQYREEIDEVVLVNEDDAFYEDADIIVIKKDFSFEGITQLLINAYDIHHYSENIESNIDDEIEAMYHALESEMLIMLGDNDNLIKFQAKNMSENIRRKGVSAHLIELNNNFCVGSTQYNESVPVERKVKPKGYDVFPISKKKEFLINSMSDYTVKTLSKILLKEA